MKHVFPSIFIISLALPVSIHAERADSLRQNELGEAQVTHLKNYNPLKGSTAAEVHWDMKLMQTMPQILGNADPIRYLQTLPSVQTSTEYDAGLHVQGCNNGQNALLLGHTVIYTPTHLMGIFSTFNSSHFKAMRFSPHASANQPSRLGGVVEMELQALPYEARNKVEGEVSVGPLTSQGTLRLTPSPQTLVTLSGRQAYFNLLYSKWLDMGGEKNRYGFGDYNATVNWKPNERHLLTFNGYYGQDRLEVTNSILENPSTLHWSNTAAEISWMSSFPFWKLEQNLTFSASESHLDLDFNNTKLDIPAHIHTISYRAEAVRKDWTIGTEWQIHNVLSQNPKVDNGYGTDIEPQAEQHAQEYTLFALWNVPIPIKPLEAECGLRTTIFHTSGESTYFKANPSLTMTWNINDAHRLELQSSVDHQFLHQTGFTSLGMPTEFWFASSKTHKPQRAESISLLYDAHTRDNVWKLAAQAYYKRLHHQTEYDDNVISLLEGIYSLDQALLEGNGSNYGIGIQITRQTGRITGWMSYAFGRSRRKFNGIKQQGDFPSNHERLHEFNISAMWRANPRLSFSGTAVCASGTPFTAAKGFYMINGYVVAEYGKHNGARLPTYSRVDLAMNYDFKPRTSNQRVKHSLNVSLFNAFGIKNHIFYRLKTSEKEFYYRPISFLIYPLPSFNYKITF